MEQLNYALITGASEGIGLELAKIAAKEGNNLILVARNRVKLSFLKETWEKEYNIDVHTLACDLSDANSINLIVNYLNSNKLNPCILINNAGFGLFGSFDSTNHEKEANMIHLNIFALTLLTKQIYKKMKETGRGMILNVSSVAGFMPGPFMSVYYASKAYVLSFSQALANEAKENGISVTVLCPGPTDTGFEKNAELENSMLFKNFGKLPSAQKVAEYGYQAMKKRKIVAIHGFGNKLMVWLLRFLPRNIITGMVRYIQRPVN